jgi:hypothetical protein
MEAQDNSPVKAQSFQAANGQKIDLRAVAMTGIPHLVAILTELVMTGKVNFKSNGRDKAIIGQLLQALLDEFKRVQGIGQDERL